MRTLVFGDIHGAFKALLQVIKRAKINKNDRLIFLGDYVDGWSENAEVIEYLLELRKNHTCILIKGNHDQFLENYLSKGDLVSNWFQHGGLETVASYNKLDPPKKIEHLKFIEKLQLYFIDENNNLYVHAGFTSLYGPEHELNRENLFWDRTLFETALSMDKDLTKDSIYFPSRFRLFNEIYIGHTSTTKYKTDQPINCANLWNLDTGAAYTGRLTCLDVESKEIFQSDVVQTLYPNELGRN